LPKLAVLLKQINGFRQK